MNRATVTIPEKLFFKIGEVCDITGVQAHVLRYWESEFPMLAPQKNRAGQRTYRKRDVEMALRIKELLYEDQYTIAGAKKKLASELRGASKLKVVTPEMSAAPPTLAAAPPSQTQTAPPPPQTSIASMPTLPLPAVSSETTSNEGNFIVDDERRLALRRLRSQAYEVLALLDATDLQTQYPRK